MEEQIIQLENKIKNHLSLSKEEETKLSSLLSLKMNLSRCDAILDIIFKVRLDKHSVFAFLAYQKYKVLPEEEAEILKLLNAEEITMFQTYKAIKDINEITLSDNIEDIKNMFIALSKDIRVVIIKLAGVLYDISCLSLPLSEKEKNFVCQVRDIHAPLSERLGFDFLKLSFEDNVIRLFNNSEYLQLKSTLEAHKEENENQLILSKKRVEEILKDLKIEGEIQYRQKHISSIFKKIRSKNSTLTQIYDLLAMRVIVRTVEECYAVLGRIHGIYKIMPGRVKDYISSPKPNGYQSLHTTIIVENQHPMEVQIRTQEMHRESEFGVYSHWLYKEKKTKKNDLDLRFTWFREIVDSAKEMKDEEFIESLKSNLYNGVIFVQTPKGRVIEFPEGATAIDFAYAVHSGVGNSCVGAKINGKMQPITKELKNGDIVEILTSSHSKGPSRDWLNYVKTSGAKSKIKAFFKSELKEENIKFGKASLNALIQEKGLNSNHILSDKYLNEILARYNMNDTDELYASIGSGSLTSSQVLGRIINQYQKDNIVKKPNSSVVHLKKNKDGVLVDGDSGMLVRFAGCCNAIEGDQIIGYISRGKGVTIHRHNCPNLKYLEPERLIEATWQEKEGASFLANICIEADSLENCVGKITNSLASQKVAIKGFEAKENKGNTVCNVAIEVKNKNELEKIMNSLRALNGVINVQRGERWI
jgi:GTP pyrophosphokinase